MAVLVCWGAPQTMLSCSPQRGKHPLQEDRSHAQICFHKACRRNSSGAAPASFAKVVPMPLINFT